ncbi:unnamed protein product [Prorocentrum cordatum]|uniref:RNase H type-1 domain-containing protein n=1 Tax=Prorocentrum cordatum TaxID=2364126 RepID=A0ABN9R8F6_9DINO|nr:unnamed protein product [Polarella glacialis]
MQWRSSKKKRKDVYDYSLTLTGWGREAYISHWFDSVADIKAKFRELLQDRAPTFDQEMPEKYEDNDEDRPAAMHVVAHEIYKASLSNDSTGFIDGTDHIGFYGTVDGEQSVPAAEHAGLFWALALTRGPLLIITDCQLVMNGWTLKYYEQPQGAQRPWWERIKLMLSKRSGGVYGVRVQKCLSHLDGDSVKQAGQEFHISMGNEMADTLAQRGAEEAMAETRQEVKALVEAETTLMRAQRRAAAIIHEVCKDADPTKLERPKQMPKKIAKEGRYHIEKESGHITRKKKGQWVCQECWLTPGKYSVVDWMKANVCIGRQYETHRADHGHTVRVPNNELIEIKDKVIHDSHSIAVAHGQFLCWNCAAVASHNDYGHGRVNLLATECRNKITQSGTTDYHLRLARIGQMGRCRLTADGYHELQLGDDLVVDFTVRGYGPAEILWPGVPVGWTPALLRGRGRDR